MIDKLNKKSKTFCIMPFIHLNHKQNNKIGTCWRALPVGDLETESFEEIWNNENMRRVRSQLLNNERPAECVNCWKLEDSGAVSYRININHDEKAKEREFCNYVKELDEGTMRMPFKIPYMELRISNQCNLKCRMCSPRFSSNWEYDVRTDKDLQKFIVEKIPNYKKTYKITDRSNGYEEKSNDRILKLVKDNAKYLKYLMIGGGEPILQKEHYKILDYLRPYSKNITLEYTSNLSFLGDGEHLILDYWKDFKNVQLKVSLDGDPEIYSYVRRNANTGIVEKNIREVLKNFNENQLRLTLTCTSSVYNIERLPEAMNWFTSLGGWAHTSLVLYPEFLSVQIFPKELKRKITDKIEFFLTNLDKNIDWNAHQKWRNSHFKKLQKERIKRFTRNCLNFMNGDERQEHWKRFLAFNDCLDKKKNSILDIYPNWDKYVLM